MALDGLALRRQSCLVADRYDVLADGKLLSKGGYSLRKHARMDYPGEQTDDDVRSRNSKSEPGGKLTTAPGTLGRKRRATYGAFSCSSDKSYLNRRSGKSFAVQPATSIDPKTWTRKLRGNFKDYMDQLSDNELQDTILVGVSMSDFQSLSPRTQEGSEELAPLPRSPSRAYTTISYRLRRTCIISIV